ncbi:hypothetical protein DL765_002897 [Monosporascus sp. GIB2]|nr:hypothetical protein DL765_002897 [Monosporascus sp. GIB2]
MVGQSVGGALAILLLALGFLQIRRYLRRRLARARGSSGVAGARGIYVLKKSGLEDTERPAEAGTRGPLEAEDAGA